MECYAKDKQYLTCGIYARLELRCLDAGGTIEEAARRTISMLGELLTEGEACLVKITRDPAKKL